MSSRNGKNPLQAKSIEFVGITFMFWAVDFVYRIENRLVGAPQKIHHRCVTRMHSLFTVSQKDHQIGLFHRHLCLLTHLHFNRGLTFSFLYSPGIHQAE